MRTVHHTCTHHTCTHHTCTHLTFFLLTRDVLPSQGGRYTGFGNTPQPDSNRKEDSNEFMASTWSSLATVSTGLCFVLRDNCFVKGWSHFTSGASTLASQAGEKAAQLGSAFESNVLKPSAQQVSVSKIVVLIYV